MENETNKTSDPNFDKKFRIWIFSIIAELIFGAIIYIFTKSYDNAGWYGPGITIGYFLGKSFIGLALLQIFFLFFLIILILVLEIIASTYAYILYFLLICLVLGILYLGFVFLGSLSTTTLLIIIIFLLLS